MAVQNKKETEPKTVRNLLRGAAGVVAVVLVFLCVKECKDKNDAIAERDAARTEAEVANERAQENEIALEQARDSLNNCMNCRRRSSGRSNSGRASAHSGRVSVTAANGSVVVTESGESNVVVTSTGASTNTDVVPSVGASANKVEFGDGAHDNVVNVNSGVINNYYGTKNDTARTQSGYVRCYTGRVVRCR